MGVYSFNSIDHGRIQMLSCIGFRIRHETLDEGQTYRLKRCEYSNEDEVNMSEYSKR